jgi:hypothetical protein
MRESFSPDQLSELGDRALVVSSLRALPDSSAYQQSVANCPDHSPGLLVRPLPPVSANRGLHAWAHRPAGQPAGAALQSQTASTGSDPAESVTSSTPT